MRKIFTFLAASAMVLSASAQGYEGNKILDNWSFGVEGGVTTSATGTPKLAGSHKAWQSGAFFGGMRGIAGAELSKQLIPAFAVGLQGRAAFNWTDSKTAVDYVDATLIAKLNFFNLFAGYANAPRFFEVEGMVGAGTRFYFSHNANYVGASGVTAYTTADSGTRNSLIAKAGLNLLFNLGESKAWTVSLKPAIVWDLDGFPNHYANGATFDINSANFELLAGITYHFKGSNGFNHMTRVRPYDQEEVDGLNARINALRGELADKDARIAGLIDELNDCRNRQPQVVEKVVEKVVAGKDNNTLETNVYFPIGKSVIPASQIPSVERVASYLKNHKDSKVVIKGYASKDGPEDLNIKLANNRAVAVKDMLVKKYGIAASRIDASGNGITDMYSEAEWNRVSVCTLNVTE